MLHIRVDTASPACRVVWSKSGREGENHVGKVSSHDGGESGDG